MLNLTFVKRLKILLCLALIVTLAPAVTAPTSSEAAGVLVICTSIKSGRSMVSKTGKCNERLYEARNWYAVGKVPFRTPRSKIISITVCTSKKYKSQLIRSKCNYRTQLSTKYQRRIGPPSAPQVPTIIAKSLGTASLRLTPPEDDGGAAIKSYIVTAYPGEMTFMVKPDNAKNVKITGLTPGLTYTFTVTATNSQGVSDSSRHTPHMMAPNVPSSPKISSIFLTGRNSARITYSQPESDGASEITDYTAVLVPGNIPIASRQISTGILEVWGLPYSTTHTISLIAHNSFGPSPASAGSPSITTEAPPQTPDQTPPAETAPETTPTAQPVPESTTPATALSSSKVISLFSFKDLSPPVDAYIDEGAGAITATVSCSTSLSTLVATFTHSSSSTMTVNAFEQTSGIVINDYTMPLEFLVTAADSSTKRYIVSVTREPCAITYDANGGSGQPTPQTKIDGVTLSLSSVLPTRSGYTFNGWNTAANGSGTTYAAGSTYSAEQDVTLYAQWSANTLTITYDVNGSSMPSGGSGTTVTGGTISALSIVEYPGYTFAGWFTAASGGIKITTDSPHNQTENFTLYAQGTANTIVISYDANGGATPSGGSATTVTGGSIATLATTSYTGYTFTGWFTAASGGTQITTSAGHDQTSNFTLYAQWTIKILKITYVLNGGSKIGEGSKDTEYFGTITTLQPVSYTGWTFLGWFTAPEGGIQITTSEPHNRTSNFTLYAQWRSNTYSVGSTGPGGGKVFYVYSAGFNCGPTFTQRCYYLEVAPNTWSGGNSDPSYNWTSPSSELLDISNESNVNDDIGGLGLGYKNSISMADLDPVSSGAYARDYQGGGKNDWYLPTSAELNQLCKWANGNVNQSTLGNACINGILNSEVNGFSSEYNFLPQYYWASSERTPLYAWSQSMEAASTSPQLKNYPYYVRPVRSF